MDDRHEAPSPDDATGIDAQFAAMVEGLDLSDEARADLDAVRAGDADGDAGPDGRRPAGRTVEEADAPPAGDPQSPDGAAGELTPRQEAEVEALTAALNAEAPDADRPRAVKVAVVLTPLASAEALAGLCAMSGLDCTVVPAGSGAFAVKEFVSAHAEWDVAELLGGVDTEPAEAAELAGALSRFSRGGAVLMTADLATDVGIESGLSGTITARRFDNGKAGEEASAGLLLANVDQSVEDVLLGIAKAEELPGALRTTEVKPSRAVRWLGRGLRRRGRAD